MKKVGVPFTPLRMPPCKSALSVARQIACGQSGLILVQQIMSAASRISGEQLGPPAGGGGLLDNTLDESADGAHNLMKAQPSRPDRGFCLHPQRKENLHGVARQ